MTTTTKAVANEHGVRWAPSKNGRLRIAVGPRRNGGGYEVWALYNGTHDLAYVTRRFATEEAANRYANSLWGRN